MSVAFSRMGLFLDFIGCFILLIDSIRNSSRIAEHYMDTSFSLFWQQSCFKNLPIKAFAFLALGFLLQFIASWLPN
jgi:hypothetical protein